MRVQNLEPLNARFAMKAAACLLLALVRSMALLLSIQNLCDVNQ